MQIVTTTDIKEFPLLSRGKVRDIYEVSPDSLLIVTTDRISAYDVIMPDPIPFKGAVLNTITLFWMDRFKGLVKNHTLASRADDFPAELRGHRELLEGRAVIVRKANPLPIECIVRGYITGSGWKDYLATGEVCGHALPGGLEESQMLETPLFTPSTKADLGQHDENITTAKAADMLGKELFDKVERVSLSIYSAAREYARERGIIIADTKFEFGTVDGELILIDEVLTPGLLPLLAHGRLPARAGAAQLRQAVPARLADLHWVQQAPPRSGHPPGHPGPDPGQVPGSLPPFDRSRTGGLIKT